MKHFHEAHSFRYAAAAFIYSSLLLLLTYFFDRYLGLTRTVTFLLVLSPILFGIIGFVIGHKEDLYRKAIFHSNHDYMTGLSNHSGFQERLSSEISRARRCNKKVALLMIDLDDFKRVNNSFGHEKGDEVLKLVGGFLNDRIRRYDLAARYGGEKFAVIMPEIKAKDAVAAAERLRDRLATDIAVDAGVPEGYISASFGIADYPTCATDVAGLVSAADFSLLFSKRKGGNCVTHYHNVESTEIQEADVDDLQQLQGASFKSLKSLVETVDSLDLHHTNHFHVDKLVADLAGRLDLDDRQQEMLILASRINEIGNLEVPGSVMHNENSQKNNEKRLLQRHPELGELLAQEVMQIRELFTAIRYHHEHWDGTGLPEGLKGEDIPVLARIVAILDAYTAMASDRPFHPAMPESKVIAELSRRAGSQFDENIVAALVDQLRQDDYKKAS